MKISSRGVKPTTVLQMSLPALSLRFTNHILPSLKGYSSIAPIEFNEDATTYFDFADTHEIDLLIHILEKFKRECKNSLGEYI